MVDVTTAAVLHRINPFRWQFMWFLMRRRDLSGMVCLILQKDPDVPNSSPGNIVACGCTLGRSLHGRCEGRPSVKLCVPTLVSSPRLMRAARCVVLTRGIVVCRC